MSKYDIDIIIYKSFVSILFWITVFKSMCYKENRVRTIVIAIYIIWVILESVLTTSYKKTMFDKKRFIIRLFVSILFWINIIKVVSYNDSKVLGMSIALYTTWIIIFIFKRIERFLTTSYMRKRINGELSTDNEKTRELFLDKDGDDISSDSDIESDNTLLNFINSVLKEISLPMIDNIISMIETFKKNKEYIMAKQNGELPHDKYNQYMIDKARELHERQEEQKSRYVYVNDNAAMESLTANVNNEIAHEEHNGNAFMPTISTENSDIQNTENDDADIKNGENNA